jgi:uncharacterized protein YbjT (DUF2867 family)
MILVTTAGKVGTETATLLAREGRDVRALVRDASRHGELATAGVELVTGDLDNPAAVQDALNGVDSVVLVSPAVPSQELAVVAAAADAGVTHIVKVSSKASPDSPVARRRGQSEIEAGLLASQVPHTLLRPNAYMQNLLAVGPVVAATGGFAASTGNGQVGLTDARDVAAVAAHLVGNPGHGGKTYWVTGPELLSYADIADILSRVLGRSVTFTPRTHDEDLSAFIAAGVPEVIAANNAMAFSLIAHGDAAWLSDDLPDLLGRPARAFEDFAREHASAFTAKPN